MIGVFSLKVWVVTDSEVRKVDTAVFKVGTSFLLYLLLFCLQTSDRRYAFLCGVVRCVAGWGCGVFMVPVYGLRRDYRIRDKVTRLYLKTKNQCES